MNDDIEIVRRGFCRVTTIDNRVGPTDEYGIALRPMPWVNKDEVRGSAHHNDPQRIIDALAALDRIAAALNGKK